MKARIHRHPRSPFWSARFKAWDATRQDWITVTQSTKVAERAAAQKIADEWARIAQSAGPDGRITREHVTRSINHILALAGHREVIDSESWASYAARWETAMGKRVPTNLSRGTFTTYQGHLKNFAKWLGREASAPLASLTADHLQTWYRAQIDAGLAVTTVNNMTTTLSTIFQRAIDEGLTPRNPVNLIDRDDHTGNTRDPFTLEDQAALLAHLHQRPDLADWHTVTLLGLCTSQRLTDCANALRAQFEFEKPWLIWSVTQGKTGKKLRIPIVEPAAEHIARILRQTGDSLFLAPSLAGLPAGHVNGLSAQFARILADCGITGRTVPGKGKGRTFHSKTFHSTRHTCNTALANAGIPADVRQLITGHADTATNIVYTHLADTTKANALQKAFKRPRKSA